MQNYFKSDSPDVLVFTSKIEDIPGGITVAVKDLSQPRIYAATPVGKDESGLYHVVKTAKIQTATDAATDTAYKVAKGHNFKVGDVLASGAKGYAITAIDTTAADYDLLTVGTTLGAAAVGDILYEGSKAAATGVTFKYTPEALTGETFDVVEGDNHSVGAIVRGSVVKANIVAPISDAIVSALPLIRFV
jgi:hypothetical protein